MDEIKDALVQILDKPLMRGGSTVKVCAEQKHHTYMVQYQLLFTSIYGCLSYLANAKEIKYWFEDGRLLWERSKK